MALANGAGGANVRTRRGGQAHFDFSTVNPLFAAVSFVWVHRALNSTCRVSDRAGRADALERGAVEVAQQMEIPPEGFQVTGGSAGIGALCKTAVQYGLCVKHAQACLSFRPPDPTGPAQVATTGGMRGSTLGSLRAVAAREGLPALYQVPPGLGPLTAGGGSLSHGVAPEGRA